MSILKRSESSPSVIGDQLPPSATLGLREIYQREQADARKKSFGGAMDMMIGAKSVLAGSILEILQTEQQERVSQGLGELHSNWIVSASTLPVDWKAVALAGSIFALTSGTRRASRQYTIGRDIERTILDRQIHDATIIPHTEDTYKTFARRRRIRDAGMTLSSTYLAYEVGTHLPLQQSLSIGAAISAVAVGRLMRAKRQFAKRGY